MAHFYLIISLFSCILFSQVNDLKVISYNIRYDNPDDGDNNWKHRKETLINYFNENKPDLIGMQEVLITQLSFLDKSLDEYKYVGDWYDHQGSNKFKIKKKTSQNKLIVFILKCFFMFSWKLSTHPAQNAHHG